MIHTIRLDHVLRETIKTPYTNLVTRATGAAVRTSIEATIAGSDCGTALLDFSAVGLVDLSCADEVVAKLLLGGARDGGASGDRFIMLSGLHENHTEAIDHVLNHHQLAIAVVGADGDRPHVLGHVSPDLRSAFVQLQQSGPATATAMAEALEWAVDRALEALDALVGLRLLRREGASYFPLLSQ
ncbi:MAG: hypothetical protein ABJD11_14640 [Gemmatimonadota bacterium]